ncbi:MAG: transglutaminase domain-containing protein [Gammaproteobacteria bacterium]
MTAASEARVPLPRGWLAAGLVLWGVCAGALAAALVMAALLEGITFAPIKWTTATREFHRAADLTSVLFAIVTVVQFQRYGVRGIYELLAATPYCFLPLVLIQRASTAQTLPASALFYSLRRREPGVRRIDIAPAYLGVCLLAASAVAPDPRWFAAIGVVLVAGLAWAASPARWSRRHLALVLALGMLLATGLGLALTGTRAALESAFLYWMSQHPWMSSAPNRAVTSIGHIGRLKLSDRIDVRVTGLAGTTLPFYLHEASYDTFRYGSWSVDDSFEVVDQDRGRDRWTLNRAPATASPIDIGFRHRHELSLLPLPPGTWAIGSGEIAELQRNRPGAVMAEAPPGAVRYTALTGGSGSRASAPGAADRVVPDAYREVIARVAADIGVEGHAPAVAAARIRDHFLANFHYSLVQRAGLGRRTPLARFLEVTRRGHCEHFATAAVLLLREAGIPARYAVGYAVDEYSRLEAAWVARARHAHAWAEAWIDGTWVTIDATPPDWFALEEARVPAWQGIQDLLAWAWYRYQRLAQADLATFDDYLPWLLPPLAVLLYLRLRRSPAAVRARRRGDRAAAARAPATPLTPLLDHLATRGLEPAAGETLARFLARAAEPERNGITLDSLVDDYYCWRFGHARETTAAPLARRVQHYLAAPSG